MYSKGLHYVYQSSPNLRMLEDEFADGISRAVGVSGDSRAQVKTRRGFINITFFIYRRAHLMMSHGVADKNYLLRQDPKGGLEINKYQAVCVPGFWIKQKLLAHKRLELDSHQIKVVGWPRIDALLAAAATRPERRRPSTRSEIKVLWAPTHGSEVQKGKLAVSSYPALMEYEEKLADIFDFEVSLHPNVRGGGRPTFEQLLDADVVIADRGTMVYEAWALGKPVVFPSWLIGEGNKQQKKGSAENHIFKSNIGCHAWSFDELVDMVINATGLGADVSSFMQDYLPPHVIGRSYDLIADAVLEIDGMKGSRIKPKVRVDDEKKSVLSDLKQRIFSSFNIRAR